MKAGSAQSTVADRQVSPRPIRPSGMPKNEAGGSRRLDMPAFIGAARRAAKMKSPPRRRRGGPESRDRRGSAHLGDLALAIESDGDRSVAGIARLPAPRAVGAEPQATHAGI